MPAIEKSPEIIRLRSKLGVELLWVYVLTLLKKEPSHAYVLRKKIESEFSFTPGNVSAYVVLYKLKSRGYVTSKKNADKKVYTITAKGKALLKEAQKVINEKENQLFD